MTGQGRRLGRGHLEDRLLRLRGGRPHIKTPRNTTCHNHNYNANDIVVVMPDSVTTAQAAQRLGVNTSRVRTLIANGTLSATHTGSQWLIDPDSLDRHADLISAGATGRPFASRTAWAAAALCDGLPDGLKAQHRHRLYTRLIKANTNASDICALVRRWLSRRAQAVRRYRISEAALTELKVTPGVLLTGVSAADTYGLGLGTGGAADAYLNDQTHNELVENLFLIPSTQGNLTLRVTDTDQLTSDTAAAPRLIAGADLADDTDARTRAAGCSLINDALRALPNRK